LLATKVLLSTICLLLATEVLLLLATEVLLLLTSGHLTLAAHLTSRSETTMFDQSSNLLLLATE